MSSRLPLFPLNTVLLPGGTLQLRIFEPRYVDMIGACGREGSGFGVCLIQEGSEVGAPAATMAVGTEARIVDFTTLADGLLGITVRGCRRFFAESALAADDGLVVAQIEWFEEEAPLPIPVQYELLATLLRRYLERSGGFAAVADDAAFADAAWVGWRLADALPLGLEARQRLLEESDPAQRLQQLLEAVGQLQSD